MASFQWPLAPLLTRIKMNLMLDAILTPDSIY
jgi:hypothetical protein